MPVFYEKFSLTKCAVNQTINCWSAYPDKLVSRVSGANSKWHSCSRNQRRVLLITYRCTVAVLGLKSCTVFSGWCCQVVYSILAVECKSSTVNTAALNAVIFFVERKKFVTKNLWSPSPSPSPCTRIIMVLVRIEFDDSSVSHQITIASHNSGTESLKSMRSSIALFKKKKFFWKFSAQNFV